MEDRSCDSNFTELATSAIRERDHTRDRRGVTYMNHNLSKLNVEHGSAM
jgi:hypothetical protein